MSQQLAEPHATSSAVGPSHVRYYVLAWFCTLSMMTYIDRVCIMEVQDDIQRDLGFAKDQMWWMFSAFALAYALFEVPSGWLGDRLGPRKVLTRIVLCWLFFTAMTGLVWGLVSLIVIRFLFGAGEAGAYPNMARGAKNWFPFSERGRAQGLVWTFGRWGGAVAPILITGLALFSEALGFPGWRGAFVLLGVVGVLWVVGFSIWFRDTPRDHPHVNEEELAHIEDRPARHAEPPQTAITAFPERVSLERHAAPAFEPTDALRAGEPPPAPPSPSANSNFSPHAQITYPPLSWSSMLTSPTLWCLSFMYFCSNSGWSFFITFVNPYLKQDLGLSGLELSLAAGLPLFFGGIGCLLGGLFTDRQVRFWGRRWGRTLQGVVAYALGGAFFLVAIALTDTNKTLAFGAICLASFVKDFAMGASWATTIDIGHRYSGTVAGMMNTIGNLGTVFSPPIVTFLVLVSGLGAAGKWGISLYYYAAMFLIAAVCWFFINPRNVIVYRPEDKRRLQAEGIIQ
jgi:ACS family glucarate transporter-like MFS transporter